MINITGLATDNRRNLAAVLLVTVFASIIYSNTFDASFHFDDQHSIVENYAIHRFDVKEIFSKSSRPVLDLTFAANYYFGKLNVFGYHLVNLLLHISNGIMLYFILLWTVRMTALKDKEQAGIGGESHFMGPVSFRMPLYAAMIFVAHPIQTQAVTYIVSRSSVLAAAFYLLALLLFIRSFKSSRPVVYLAGAFVSSCLGMLSKEEAATLPVMILLYDYFFISDGKKDELKKHYKTHLVMFASLSVLVYRFFSFGFQRFVSFDYTAGVPMLKGDPITSFEYFMTQLHVIPYYIRLLFVPIDLNLDYDWPVTRHIDFPTIFFFILLLTIIALALKLFKRERLISFGIIWFFVTISITSSFLVIYDVIFEHRLYLPSIGFALILSTLISKISGLSFKKAGLKGTTP